MKRSRRSAKANYNRRSGQAYVAGLQPGGTSNQVWIRTSIGSYAAMAFAGLVATRKK